MHQNHCKHTLSLYARVVKLILYVMTGVKESVITTSQVDSADI